MKSKLSDIVTYISEKINTKNIDLEEYISTENMLPDKGGIVLASSLPSTPKTNSFNIGDVLFSNIRTYFRKVWFATFSGGVSADVLVFRSKNSEDLYEKYLYYILSDEAFIQYTVTSAKGTKMPRGDKSAIMNYEVKLPSLPTQKRIAYILSTLDDKIELNRKMNQTLEEIAQALFKSWFVDFDPVYAKAGCSSDDELKVVARELGISKEVLELFPSEFDDSALGMIPNGWEWKTLGEILIPKKGRNITKDTITEGSIPVVAGGLTPAYYHSEYNAKAPVITISASGANAGYVHLYTQNIWASDCSYINDGMTQFIYSVYLFLKQKQKEITRMQQGAVQPHIYPKDLMRLIVADCGSTMWSLLEKNVEPMFDKIRNNQMEIKTLQKTRDTLLPKLLSGELDVSELDMGEL